MISRISRIMRVDRDEAVNTEATHLSVLLQDEQKARDAVLVSDFYYQEPNPYLQPGMKLPSGSAEIKAELGAMLFLGHTDTADRSFGGYSPEEFADHFAEAFAGPKPSQFSAKKPYTHADKLAVKDLFVIACAMGLSSPGKNDAYAQRLVNRLHERGFTNARVHAVAYEQQVRTETMYVEIVTDPAVYDKKTKRGYLAAYSLDEASVLEIAQKRHIIDHAKEPGKASTIKEAQRQIRHIYEEARRARPAISGPVSPLVLLSRAENTFLPHETYRQRKQRIAQDTNYKERQARAQLIPMIMRAKERHQGDKQIPFIQLEMSLENDHEPTWQQLCETARVAYDKTFTHNRLTKQNKVINPDDDLRLLEKLSQGTIPSPEEIAAAESKQVQPEHKAASLTRRPAARKDGSLAHPTLGFFPSAPPSPKSSSTVPEHLRTAIEKLQTALDDEILQLRDRAAQSCITFFLDFEANTKTRKRDSLADLLTATSLDDLQTKARAALGETRVTWRFRNSCSTEWGKSRTRDLLKHIVENPDGLLPEERQPFLAARRN